MAHMIKGNGAMQRPITTSQQQAHKPQGVIVGAVVNKPGSTPSGIQVTSSAGLQLQPGVMATNQNTPGILLVNPAALKSTGVCDHDLANKKEKTPMCLVNELARYNKIQHQYTLTDEKGPAHDKTFFVLLKLGNEEYAASGASIKKAQHCAAGIALQQTHYPKPPIKPRRPASTPPQHSATHRHHIEDPNKSLTPTVELNALVMRRGELATYRPVEMPMQKYYPQGGGAILTPGIQGSAGAGVPGGAAVAIQGGAVAMHGAAGGIQGDIRAPYHAGRGYKQYPRMFFVSLVVGDRKFMGEGNTRQTARHNAAEKALKVLKALPLPDLPEASAQAPPTEDSRDPASDGESGVADNGLKSEISLVHEIALKRSLGVTFEVVRESGPPHLKNFLTRCSCGNISVEGEGNSKKSSKKRAAEAMLDKLRDLPPLPCAELSNKKPTKKKNRNLIKIQKASPDYGMQINPISRLIQIQQAKKEKEPIYTLVEESGKPRKREFVIQVAVGAHKCHGVGPNKKLAKRHAAELMLQELGYSKPAPQPAKPAIRSPEGAGAGDKKVTFVDQESSASRQLVPGVIFMPPPEQKPLSGPPQQGYGVQGALMAGYQGQQGMVVKHAPHTIAAIAKELLDTRQSGTAEAIRQRAHPNTIMAPLVRPEQQLFYMGEVLGFQVIFTDFPKGNKNECLSLVTLNTVPPQVSHGAGVSREASHDTAALQALKALAMFDTSAPGAQPDIKREPVDHRGDGLHITTEQ